MSASHEPGAFALFPGNGELHLCAAVCRVCIHEMNSSSQMTSFFSAGICLLHSSLTLIVTCIDNEVKVLEVFRLSIQEVSVSSTSMVILKAHMFDSIRPSIEFRSGAYSGHFLHSSKMQSYILQVP